MSTTAHLESLGEYLCRLRESRNLSMRQAAKEADISGAYLSQVESGKRGKRKKGADYFGPHPQILKKLARVYHVPSAELMQRAGYLDDDRADYGFSEERETNRVFEYVIRDPLLVKILTTLDKRAIVNRYEAITGKRLIIWAGEAETPLAAKQEFSGIRHAHGQLYAETPNTTLTLAEVAQELSTAPEEVKKMIHHGWLDAKKGPKGELLIEKRELRGFVDYALRDGIQLRVYTPKAERPNTPTGFRRSAAEVAVASEKDLPAKLAQISKQLGKEFKGKGKR